MLVLQRWLERWRDRRRRVGRNRPGRARPQSNQLAFIRWRAYQEADEKRAWDAFTLRKKMDDFLLTARRSLSDSSSTLEAPCADLQAHIARWGETETIQDAGGGSPTQAARRLGTAVPEDNGNGESPSGACVFPQPASPGPTHLLHRP